MRLLRGGRWNWGAYKIKSIWFEILLNFSFRVQIVNGIKNMVPYIDIIGLRHSASIL